MFSTIKLVLITLIFLVVASGLWYVSNLKADIAILEQNEIKLKDGIESQKQVIETKIREIQEIQIINNGLNQTIESQNKEIKNLNDKFNVSANGQSRDLGAITRIKPKIINSIVDRATSNANRCFELATGAKLQPGEKNDECKELIKSLN